MPLSVIEEQRNIILQEIKNITKGDWKCLIVDTNSKKIVDNCVNEDAILNINIANIERIEDRREQNPDMDAIYILSPEPHIVDCLLHDFSTRKYRSAFLVWTNLLPAELRRKIDEFPGVRQLRSSTKTLFIDFYPRESHLITFRDPWSFPVLYHRKCDSLVAAHLKTTAQRIAGICITLGEYPKVRYYKPREPTWEAAVLCSHLANFVQQELDMYAQWNKNFPPPSTRPQGTLLITDRAMDIISPLVHEFTYQAMAHDLLSIKEGEKVTYHTTINQGTPEAEEKDMELSDKDKIWVENRHRHMKDTIDKLMGDFRRFLEDNPHFANENADTTNLNAIRDMLAGLPQFQEMKEAYSLHLTMAQECMNIFQHQKLPDVASSEQTMATGLDEDYRKPKNVLDAVVRLLDDEAIKPADRLRLIILYVLYRDGVVLEDIKRLLAHASLPQSDVSPFSALEFLGGRAIRRELKDIKPPRHILFPEDPRNAPQNEEYSLSRHDPVLKPVLENLTKGTLDSVDFPYVKPPIDPNEDLLLAQGASLRAGGPRPNWAAAGRRQTDTNRQRILVFLAGGATYSESRVAYEVSHERNKDVILATSHMLTPALYIRQLGDLCRGRRQLDLPADRPKPRAPAHVFERPAPPPQPQASLPAAPRPGAMRPPPQQQPAPGPRGPSPNHPPRIPPPPTQQMDNLSVGGGPENGTGGKLHKEKKRRNFLGMKK
ncbi:Sec1-like protein [Emericellopsis atlantica]|uniref:Sec1-like protein n=1 Tax=Emericellopsis atlantica TaxID=2614577 RepID=A0A9P7ZLM0_9HYPO|nr:Sec1-like protein [Emericellopsis atlantica]KAG9254275.1 Sec1-like protein [Emericellopsis atlantica]